ncbi:hypothetical protein AALA17_03495 [Lactobacillaceae bacterium 24-114]
MNWSSSESMLSIYFAFYKRIATTPPLDSILEPDGGVEKYVDEIKLL